MKKILSFLWIMAAMFAVSCQKENEVKDEPLTFSKVKVAIGDEGLDLDTESGTKSLISVDTEDFVDAYLFAFDASTKKILTYDDGTPVAMYTDSKEFNWNLPINKAIDLWVACNTGSSNTWKTAFENAYINPNLTESSIYGDNLMFVCQTSADLIKLQTTGAGIPMSGMMNNMTISSPTATVTITVKRLFAKYQFKVIAEGLEEDGLYEVKSAFITSSKSNTQCPFFYNGHYAQTDASKLGVIDYATATDLVTADAEGYVTLYYLENAQGNKTKPDGDTKWDNVVSKYGESAMSLCSNVKIGVNIHNNRMGVDQNVGYTVYLGKTDMVTNFDVQRNYLKKVKLNLKIGNVPEYYFKFTNTEPIVISPGSYKDIPFETNISEPSFSVVDNNGNTVSGISFSNISIDVSSKTGTVKTGTVRISATSSVAEDNYILKGGTLSGDEIFDSQTLTIRTLISSYYEMKIIRTTEDAQSDGYDGWVRNPYFAYEILSRQKDTDIPDYYNDGGTTKSSSSLFIGESYGHETYGTNNDIEYIVFQLKTGVEYRIYPCSNTNAGSTGQSDAYYKPDNTYKTDYQNHPYFRIDFEYKNGSWSRRTDINLNSLSSPWKTAKAVRFKLKNISGEWNCIRQPAYNSFYSIKLIPLAGYTTNTYASGVYTSRRYIRETLGGTKYHFFGFTITTHQDPRTGAPQIPVISYDGRGTCTVNGSSKSITSIISSIQVYHNKNKTSWTSAIVSGIYDSGNFLGAHSSLNPDYSFRITSGNPGYMEGYGDVESYGMYSTWKIPLDWGRFGSKGSFEYSLVFKNVSGVADIPIHCDVLRPIASVKH